jgi:hypothetical protein
MRRSLLALAFLAAATACVDRVTAPPSTAVSAAQASLDDITLTYMCGNIFRVRNLTGDPLTLTWKVSGTTTTGTVTVQAFSETYFSARVAGTVELSLNGTLFRTAANEARPCAPVDSTAVGLRYVCGTRFAVRNENLTPLALVWVVRETAERGTLTIGPDTLVTFTTTTAGTVDLYLGGNRIETAVATGAECPRQEYVDIKPLEWPNSVNLKAKGVLPIAILTTGDLDATKIVISSVVIGGVHVDVKPNGTYHYAYEDVDHDGDLDLMVFFRIQDLVSAGALGTSTTQLTVAWRTSDGRTWSDADAVRIVP